MRESLSRVRATSTGEHGQDPISERVRGIKSHSDTRLERRRTGGPSKPNNIIGRVHAQGGCCQLQTDRLPRYTVGCFVMLVIQKRPMYRFCLGCK